MPRRTRPRHGSLAFHPRKRAREETPRFRSWPQTEEVGLLGFYGYKAGMTHVIAVNKSPGFPTSGQEVFLPATVIETPPMVVLAARFYRKTPYGLKAVGEVWEIPDKFGKYLERRIKKVRAGKKETEEFDEVRVIMATQPHLTGIGKKKPEVVEVAVGGKNPEEKKEYVMGLLGKEVTVDQVFKEGELIDVKAVTKGKGFQGPVKRFGIFEFGHKKEKTKRAVGSIGAWHPPRTMWTVPMAGQMGYHARTEYNKQVLKISSGEITPAGGFLGYGVVKNTWIMVKGSVPGPRKRLIGMRKAIRPTKALEYAITYVSRASKQGV